MLNLTPIAILFALSCLGASQVAYLIKKRRAKEAPICPIGEDCKTVLWSKYNKLLFGIHNDILGILFYLAAAIISAVFAITEEYFFIDLLILMLVGASTMSLIFIYIQWKILNKWCFWCIAAAITVLLMDIMVVLIKI